MDTDIVNTLLTFWNEKNELVGQLLSKEENLPKKFYELLKIRKSSMELECKNKTPLKQNINENSGSNGEKKKIQKKTRDSKSGEKDPQNSNQISPSKKNKQSKQINDDPPLDSPKSKRKVKNLKIKNEIEVNYQSDGSNENLPQTSFLPMYEKFRFPNNDEIQKFKSKSVDEENINNKFFKNRANSTTSVEGKSFWSRRNKKNPEVKKEKERKTSWLSVLKKKSECENSNSSESNSNSTNKDESGIVANGDDFYSIPCEFYSKEQLATILEESLIKLKVSYKQLRKGKFVKAVYTVGENSVKFTINISDGTHQPTNNGKLALLLEYYKTSGNQGLYLFICKQIEELIK